uniref:ULP_PROTEASE domain-containing protein n=1 Tax=Panagrellus redivivus TaxID=6233 RepID=A0A7E4W507_PANRE
MPTSANAAPNRPRKTRQSSLTSPPAKKVRKQQKQQDAPVELRRSARQRQPPQRLHTPADDVDIDEQAVNDIEMDDAAIRQHQQRLKSLAEVKSDGSRLVCGFRVVRFMNCTTRSAEIRVQCRDDPKFEHVYCIKHSHRNTRVKFYCKNCSKTAEDKAFVTLKVVDDRRPTNIPTGAFEVHESGKHGNECAQPFRFRFNCDKVRIYQDCMFVKFTDTVNRDESPNNESLSVQHFRKTFIYQDKQISMLSERYTSSCECRTLVVIEEPNVWINYGHVKGCEIRKLMRSGAAVPDNESGEVPFKLLKPYQYQLSDVSPATHARAVADAAFQAAALAQAEKAANQPLAAPPSAFVGVARVAEPSDNAEQVPKTPNNVELPPIPAKNMMPATTREPMFTPSPTPSDSGVSTAENLSNATLNLFTEHYVPPVTKLRTLTAQVIGKLQRSPLVTQRSYEKPESSTQDALLSDRRASEPTLPSAHSGGAAPSTLNALRRHIIHRNLHLNNSAVVNAVTEPVTSEPSESPRLEPIPEEAAPAPSNPTELVSTVAESVTTQPSHAEPPLLEAIPEADPERSHPPEMIGTVGGPVISQPSHAEPLPLEPVPDEAAPEPSNPSTTSASSWNRNFVFIPLSHLNNPIPSPEAYHLVGEAILLKPDNNNEE